MFSWLGIKRFLYSIAFIGTAAVIFFLTHFYVQFEHARAAQAVEEIKIAIKEKSISKSQTDFIKSYLQDRPESVYFLLLDPTENKGVGVVNVENFTHGAKYIDTSIQQQSMLKTFDMLKNAQKNPNKYITLTQDYWVESSLQVKYAYLNPAIYLQWGIRGPIVVWGLYLWYGLGIFLGIAYMLIHPRQLTVLTPEQAKTNRVQADPAMSQAEAALVEVALQEQPAPIKAPDDQSAAQMIFDAQDEDEDEDEEDTKVDDVPTQVWISLLEQADLKDWDTQGEFYACEDKKGYHAVGFPWASSIVTRKEVQFLEFIYEVEGRVLTGSEGFALLFMVGQHSLAWMLGGWSNSESTVLGYETTKSFHQIHPKKWYHIRVELEGPELIGYVDGCTAWTLPISDVVKDSPDTGFQRGIGVGVFQSTVKFRNLRIFKVL